MKKLTYSVLFLLSMVLLSAAATAHQGCMSDSLGKPVCAPANGGILKDRRGHLLCGAGQCQEDSFGSIICSAQAGGFATKNLRGRVVCTGACVTASQALCQRPVVDGADSINQ